MKKLIMFVMVIMLCLGTAARAQYTDYIGAGQDDDIVAEASSEDGSSPDGAFAQNTVNGSGLTGDAHSNDWEDTWTGLEETTADSPNPARGDSVWIHYDLGHVYGLGLMHVWNCNEEGSTARGPSNVTIDYSVDNTNWTELGTFDDWEEATGEDDYTGFDGPDFAGASARYVLITINSDHDSLDDMDAISEIKIEAIAAKVPIVIDSNDLPVYEPRDMGPPPGPPLMGPTEGQLLVSLGWRPGKPTYPNFIVTVVIDPNEGPGLHEDFIFPDSADPTNGTVTLTFDETDFDIPQQVIVQAVQDLDKEGDESYPVELTFTNNIADPNFNSDPCELMIAVVGVVDNDVPFVVVYPPGELENVLKESDPCLPKCVDVTLSHVPDHDVYVLVTPESEYNLLLESMSVMDPPLSVLDDPNKLTFTVSGNPTWIPGTMTSNWNVAQTICLEARDDPCLVEPWLEWVGGEIIFRPYSEDLRYLVPELYPDGTDADDPDTEEEEETSDGEAEETAVDFDVQDDECGAWGYDPVDINEDCVVDLSEIAYFYSQWQFCTQPYEDGCEALWNLEYLEPSE